ncbi:MAG: GntP family permease [Microbacteriaceae bacterium]|jgi:GntP family gluconate:H+ symporter|nr:GntP family permease [Microbacteriaceae bacterium]MCI1206742.1 GntP family permease [Microbacteriaceae bacterium]
MATASVSWIGALIGLLLAIVLILRKLNPVYSLLLGAVVGALLGGGGISGTVDIVVAGTQSVMGTVVRVLAAGVLAGVMMESGAAETIAKAIVSHLGERLAILSLALATMVITAVGVFIPVAVLIVAPIALDVGKRLGISKLALLVALSGGGKAGNVISPNPNTIAAAKGFGTDLSHVMLAGTVPALFGLATAVLLASMLRTRGDAVTDADLEDSVGPQRDLPSLGRAVITPLLAVVLLLLNPVSQLLHIPVLDKISLDSMYVLPLAALIGMVAMGHSRQVLSYTSAGIARMTDTVLILIGAGAIGGLISASDLSVRIVDIVKASGISGTFLAPLAGVLMAAAAASTSTGVILATGSFSKAILGFGVSPLGAAVMVNTGATVIDHLPHGNYFHVTGNAIKLDMKHRFAAVPWESVVGLVMTVVATAVYGFMF